MYMLVIFNLCRRIQSGRLPQEELGFTVKEGTNAYHFSLLHVYTLNLCMHALLSKQDSCCG